MSRHAPGWKRTGTHPTSAVTDFVARPARRARKRARTTGRGPRPSPGRGSWAARTRRHRRSRPDRNARSGRIRRGPRFRGLRAPDGAASDRCDSRTRRSTRSIAYLWRSASLLRDVAASRACPRSALAASRRAPLGRDAPLGAQARVVRKDRTPNRSAARAATRTSLAGGRSVAVERGRGVPLWGTPARDLSAGCHRAGRRRRARCCVASAEGSCRRGLLWARRNAQESGRSSLRAARRRRRRSTRCGAGRAGAP